MEHRLGPTQSKAWTKLGSLLFNQIHIHLRNAGYETVHVSIPGHLDIYIAPMSIYETNIPAKQNIYVEDGDGQWCRIATLHSWMKEAKIDVRIPANAGRFNEEAA